MKKTGAGILGAICGLTAGAATVYKIMGKCIMLKEQKRMKFKSYYEMTNQWLLLKNEGKSLEEYFVNNNYKTMAIYGMGELGTRLYEELNNSKKVEIKYAIDKNADGVYSELNVLSLDDKLEPVDIIVVSAIFDFDNIQDKLTKKIKYPIVSLEEVIFEV